MAAQPELDDKEETDAMNCGTARALDLAIDGAAVRAVLHRFALLQHRLEDGLPAEPLCLRAARTQVRLIDSASSCTHLRCMRML